MHPIAPRTRISKRASFDALGDGSGGNAWSDTPEHQTPATLEPELAPPAQDLAPQPAASGLRPWVGEPPPRIPFETLAPEDYEAPPAGI